jgi:hypothetical protein
MAAWLALLKHVPWGEVIRKAPAVASAAKRLWSSVEKRKVPASSAADSSRPLKGRTAMVARTTALEESVAELHEQILASSELINTLAEQNAQLVQRIEANRVRTLWLGLATAVVGVIAVAAIVMVW